MLYFFFVFALFCFVLFLCVLFLFFRCGEMHVDREDGREGQGDTEWEGKVGRDREGGRGRLRHPW